MSTTISPFKLLADALDAGKTLDELPELLATIKTAMKESIRAQNKFPVKYGAITTRDVTKTVMIIMSAHTISGRKLSDSEEKLLEDTLDDMLNSEAKEYMDNVQNICDEAVKRFRRLPGLRKPAFAKSLIGATEAKLEELRKEKVERTQEGEDAVKTLVKAMENVIFEVKKDLEDWEMSNLASVTEPEEEVAGSDAGESTSDEEDISQPPKTTLPSIIEEPEGALSTGNIVEEETKKSDRLC